MIQKKINILFKIFCCILLFVLISIQKVNAQDVGATTLVSPVNPMCPNANQTVIVSIQNFDAATIDFSINNVTVNVDITGASNQNFNVVLNSGTLISGGKQNVIVTTTADLSTIGVHEFDAYTNLVSDVNTLNDSITPVSVTIDDVLAPVANVSNLPDLIAECSITVTAIPTATDNCAGTVTATTDDTLFYDSQGPFVITWTYDDGNGNTTTQTQNVIIDDVTSPVKDVTVLPDITGICAVTVLTTPTATDNCAGTITGVTTDPLIYDIGTYTITWVFDDENGNVTNQQQNVIVSPVDTSVTVNVLTLTANNISSGVTYDWIDCNGNVIILGENNQSFSPSVDGYYAVVVTQNGCSDTSSCYQIIGTGINNSNTPSSVVMYPNPTSGLVTINLPEIVSSNIIVCDVLGQVVFSSETESQQILVNLSDYADGIFFITLNTPLYTQVFKVIKN